MWWQYIVVGVVVAVALVVVARAIRSQLRSGCDSGACGCGHSAEADPFADRRPKSTPLISLNVNSTVRSSGRDKPAC